MAEAGFSDDGKYYSLITQDGRLRVWDTETNTLKQEYTPDLHLTSPPSCLQYITVRHSTTPKQKGKRTSINAEEKQCIALGTTTGKILIYSIAEAKVETVLVADKSHDFHQSKVTALDWSKKYGLYSCNKESKVFEWDLQSGAVRNKYNISVESNMKQGNTVSAIKMVPHKQNTPAKFLVAASWQIRLWRLHNEDATLVKSFGHNTAQTSLLSLVALNDSCWLVEGSVNERLLSFWDVTITDDHLPQLNGEEPTPKRQRKKSISKAPVVNTPMYSFVLEDAPRMVDAVLKEQDGTELQLAATTRSGVVHYYGHMLNGSSTKPIKPSVTIQVSSAEARPLPAQCCRLQPAGDLILGYTQEPAIMFERVTPDLKTKTQVIIRGEVKEGKKKLKKSNEVNKVRSDANSTDATYVEPLGGVARKRITPGGEVEVPMEARLENLSLDITSRRKTAVSENLTKLLIQGLHSKDKSIILTVLQQESPRVADSTVAALPADYVPLLLEQLVDMASKKTSQCAAVCRWSGALVRRHAALLLAALGARGAAPDHHLAHLLATFTHRRSHLCQLLNLKGRVELTVSQRDASHAPQQQQEAVLDYKDTSSDEEMEVEQYQSDSAHSWNESDESEHSSDGE